MDVTARANAWMIGAHSGLSSKAIWAHMMDAGKPQDGWFHPLDPADLGRCIRLLRLIPEWRERLPEMATRSAAWTQLVEFWDVLEASMENEVGFDWSKGQSAPKTYDLMQAVLRKARAA